jgi:1-acyl-sn-glycerol-3-phosphate acyltransferase
MTFYRFVRVLLVSYLRLVYRIRVTGREHVPTSGPFILAPVHRSMLDIPVVGVISKRRVHFMGKSSLFRVPVLGWLFTVLGGFAVERDGSDTGPIRESLRFLQVGDPLVVYPEGTRQRGRTIAELQPGAAYLSAKTGAPIIPVGIAGVEETFRSRRGRMPGFGRVVVVVGEPIVPPTRVGSVVKRSVTDELSTTLHARLQLLFDEAYAIRDAKP